MAILGIWDHDRVTMKRPLQYTALRGSLGSGHYGFSVLYTAGQRDILYPEAAWLREGAISASCGMLLKNAARQL